jgi:hypothetical protein
LQDPGEREKERERERWGKEGGRERSPVQMQRYSMTEIKLNFK